MGPVKYRPDIDGLRAIAVISVVLYHAYSEKVLPGGFIGVDIFFVISGFLISSIIFANLANNNFSFSLFFSRRIIRIFPSLLIVLLACFSVGWFTMLSSEFEQLGKHISGGAIFISNFLLWSEAGYFDNEGLSKPLLHLWSLGIEEQFYILWPIILYFSWVKKILIFPTILLIASISFVFNINMASDQTQIFYSPLTRFWELLLGALLAYGIAEKTNNLNNSKFLIFSSIFQLIKSHDTKYLILNNISSILGVTLTIYGVINIQSDLIFPGYWALVPTFGALLLIAAGPNAIINKYILSNKFLIWIGLISYPLYLWHWPIFSFINILDLENEIQYIKEYAVIASLILAWLTYQIIEKPIRFGLKNKRVTALILAFLMAIIGGIGFSSYYHEGLKNRAIAQYTKEIDDAKKDWGYGTSKLVNGEIKNAIFLKGQTKNQVLFIGDSIMGMYYPRVYHLYSKPDPYYSAFYVARNHCQPIPDYNVISSPENINCTEYYKAAMLLARESKFKKIVLAGNWIDLKLNNTLTNGALQLIDDLKSLNKLDKEVIIIGSHARGAIFSPDSISKLGRFEKTLGNLYVNRKEIESTFSIKNSALQDIANQSNATFINPFDYLCNEFQCPYLLNSSPLYIDSDHIRADFIKRKATFIDEIVMKK